MSSVPTRIPEDLFALAAVAGEQMSRSAAQQLAHWARIGRSLEDSPEISTSEIRAVLDGRARYDDLPAREQAVVRATWDERIAATVEQLDFAAEFTAQGRSWSEAAPDGALVRRDPTTELPHVD